MSHYLIQASYSKQGISDLISNPQDRAAIVQSVIEGLGGTMNSFFFAFGDYDAVLIAELPDNVTAAALAMAVGSTPGLSEYKTTVLITSHPKIDRRMKICCHLFWQAAHHPSIDFWIIVEFNIGAET